MEIISNPRHPAADGPDSGIVDAIRRCIDHNYDDDYDDAAALIDSGRAVDVTRHHYDRSTGHLRG